MEVRHVTIVVSRSKPEAGTCARRAASWLTRRGLKTDLMEYDYATLWDANNDALAAALGETDVIVTFGGDGTILAVSRIAAPRATPILGVHMGRFGFIAEAHPAALEDRLADLLSGAYSVQDRMMVRGEVIRSGGTVHQGVGLNDIVISKGAMTRMLRLTTAFGSAPGMDYSADGVIVATPTGSTAYALSAGGPIVEPTVHALLVTPICPHTLAARPMIVPADETVSFIIETDGGEVMFSADSASVFPLVGGDRVIVTRAPHATRLIVFEDGSFYTKVHRRLLWGERVND